MGTRGGPRHARNGPRGGAGRASLPHTHSTFKKREREQSGCSSKARIHATYTPHPFTHTHTHTRTHTRTHTHASAHLRTPTHTSARINPLRVIFSPIQREAGSWIVPCHYQGSSWIVLCSLCCSAARCGAARRGAAQHVLDCSWLVDWLFTKPTAAAARHSALSNLSTAQRTPRVTTDHMHGA